MRIRGGEWTTSFKTHSIVSFRTLLRCRVSERQVWIAVLWSLGLMSGCGTEPTRNEPRLWKNDANHWYTVGLTGHDFTWHVCYPGPDGELGTEDDIRARRDVHLPENTKVRLRLTSDDYLYTLSLPHWNLKEIAVPDLVFQLEFQTDRFGRFDIRGDQMCGYAHADLLSQLVVQPHDQYDSWLEDRQRATLERGDIEHESPR